LRARVGELQCVISFLRDADWAGMAHSIEIRVPLVDFTLLATLAPAIALLKEGAGKAALATRLPHLWPSRGLDPRKDRF